MRVGYLHGLRAFVRVLHAEFIDGNSQENSNESPPKSQRGY